MAEWIKHSDRQPESDTDVLGAWCLGEYELHVVHFCSDYQEYRRHLDRDGVSPPDYWMPLPNPPEFEGQPEKDSGR